MHGRTNRQFAGRRGFTLVEMLVVIAIIGILAALITAAAANALWAAKQTKIKVEVDMLAGAMESFKQKYGSYPPSDLNCTAPNANGHLLSFVSRAFPRYGILSGNTLATQIYQDLTNAGLDLTHYNPQTALVFWLSGFGPDPTDPFNRNNLSVTRTPFFTFDQTRLVTDGISAPGPAGTAAAVSLTGTVAPVGTLAGATPSPYTYAVSPPSYGIGQLVYNAPYGNAAYCFFNYQSYGVYINSNLAQPGFYAGTSNTNAGIVFATVGTSPVEYWSLSAGSFAHPTISTGTGYVSPYVLDVNNNNTFDINDTFCKPTSFQIISAGQDGAFGTVVAPIAGTTQGKLYPSGININTGGTVNSTGISYDPPPPNGGSADDDNITNFCEKNNLAAAKP